MTLASDAPGPPAAPAAAPRPGGALGVVYLTVFLDLVGFGMIIPILQLYARELHATVPQTGWLLSVYSLMQLFFAPLLGRLSDRFGRRPVLLLSIFGSCASQLGYALAPSFPFLLLARALAGVCGANIAAAQAYVADVTDERSRAGAMGTLGAALGLGFIFGPFLGGELARSSARTPFFAASALSACNWLLALWLLREPRPRGERSRTAVLSWQSLLTALSAPRLLALLALFFVVTLGFSNMEGVFALFCQDRFGFDQVRVGRLFALVGVVMVVVQGVLVRRLVPRLGERRMLFLGMALMGAGLVAMALCRTVPELILGLIVMSAGSGLHSPSLSSLISREAGRQQGGVLGVSQALGALGRICGPLLGTFSFRLGTSVPYLTAAAFMGLGLVLALTLVPPD